MQPVLRRTARVIPVDPDGHVLLLLGRDPAEPSSQCWFTIGGGIDDGETDLAAAVRELYEETGIRVEASRLVGPIFSGTHSYSYGGAAYTAHSTFFAVAVDRVPLRFDGFDEDETANILEARWWAVDDLITVPLTPDLPLLEIIAAAATAARTGTQSRP
jgi:8-oxo-dGTP pyrophosphatase MutT (NUDIX family)